ncbi:MAG: FKBP-type peptidyl-prolyl cis-trans isomerase [bacterium]|nr:FKBP-type peptidyl-prolyl cis-trans isomerase [bacterium]
MKKSAGNIVIWIVVVVVVVGVLVFITLNKKAPVPVNSQLGQVEETVGDNTEVNNVTENNTMERVIQLEGVKVTILKEGTGAVAKSGDTVAMNYTGTLVDGTTFDSNVDPKFGHVEPFVFILDGGQVIKGWDVGILGMKVGEKRILTINPDFAYGATGAGGLIPPNATLNFEVELLSIK